MSPLASGLARRCPASLCIPYHSRVRTLMRAGAVVSAHAGRQRDRYEVLRGYLSSIPRCGIDGRPALSTGRLLCCEPPLPPVSTRLDPSVSTVLLIRKLVFVVQWRRCSGCEAGYMVPPPAPQGILYPHTPVHTKCKYS